jgi:hypothetical protein
MKNNPFSTLGTALDQKLFTSSPPPVKQPPKQQTTKSPNQQGGKVAKLQTTIPPKPQASKPVNQQSDTKLKKITSYLTEDAVKAMKLSALEQGKKDYQILQEALDLYLKSR